MPSEPGTLNFPTSLDDLISLVQANNHASAALGSGINNSVLLIPVTQISEFSDSGYATILDVVPNPTVIEIVKYTSKSGSDLVVPTGGRGQQGTSAASFSAGAIVEQRHTQRHHGVLRDAIIEIEKKIGYGTPLHPLDASGTNQVGVDQEIAPGKGTGNAEPGLVVVRHPLRGASGATLQSLSSAAFSLPALMWRSATSTIISNTAAETTMLNNGTTPSTKSVQGGISRPGTVYHVVIEGRINTTGTPNLTLKVKLGSTTLLDTTALATSTATNGWFRLEADIWVSTVGATANVAATFRFFYTVNQANPVTPVQWVLNSAAFATIDLTANQTLDVTAQWGTASSSNSFDIRSSTITVSGR